MPTIASDIVAVLTGGSANIDPNLSIGGNPSSQPITGVLNNLFDNINESESLAGMTDYRCIYIFNDNSTYPLYNVRVFISSQVSAGADITIGLQNTTEVQRISVSGNVASGSFDISYTPPGGSLATASVAYDADPANWATNLQTAINSIDTLDCTVTVAGGFGSRIFNVNFTDYRSHDLIGLDSTNLAGFGTISMSISKIISGSPINAVPPLLDVETTAPADVTFSSPDINTPFELGNVYAEEGFPLWVKRTIAEGTDPLANDGFVLKILANPIPA